MAGSDEEVIVLAKSDVTTEKVINGAIPKPRANIEVGVNYNLPFITPYKDGWEVLHTGEVVTVKQLSAMRATDGQARALYRLMTLPIRAALSSATFLPESVQEGGEDEAHFIEQVFTLPEFAGGMSTSFNKVIAQMLMALFDGFSAFELVFHTPKYGPLKGKWVLKKIAHRPSDTISFLMDDKGDFDGLRQQTYFQGKRIDVPIPKDSAIYYAAQEEECEFYGKSYFEAAYSHYDKKARLYYLAHVAGQRTAVGTRIGKTPQGASGPDVTKFEAGLAQLSFAQYMSLPDNFSVESLKEGGSFDFLAFVNHHNSQMSKSILAPFFDKDQGAGAGEAKIVDFGQQSNLLFILMLQNIMSEIEAIVNDKIIPRFIDWNFDSGKYPKFKFGTLTEEQKGAVLDLFTKVATISQQGLSCTPEFVHELEKKVADDFGLEIDYETIEKEMEEAKKQAELLGQVPGTVPGQEPGPGQTPGTGQLPVGPTPPSDILPTGFQLSDSIDEDILKLAGELLLEAAGEVMDEDDMIELVRHVRTQEGARRFGVPVGAAITRDVIERAKAGKPQDTGKPDSGKKTPQDTGAAPKGKVTPGDTKKPSGDGTDVVRRVWQNPKAPGFKIVEFADGSFALQRPDGTIGTHNLGIDPEKWKSLGWLIGQAKNG